MSIAEFTSAARIAPAQLHAGFTAAFADYLIGPFQLALEHWPVFLARQCVDLSASRVALDAGGAVQAFALCAPRLRQERWRLAVMGAAPAARGSGVAAGLLDDFLGRAAAAGMRGTELECFAQNTRALRLYESRGFRTLHPLHGYTRAAADAQPAGASAGAGEDVALEAAWAWLDERAAAGLALPLQQTPASLRAQPVQLRAWRQGEALVLFADDGQGLVTLHGLVDTGAGQRGAEALAARLLATYPRHRFSAPQLLRPDLGGEALERLGFARLPLHQLWMRREEQRRA
jgi:ribosomal protein S18 acetylase RimI-like enzyme